MPNKWKDERKPQCLTDFFITTANGGRQNGTEACSPPAASLLTNASKKGNHPPKSYSSAIQNSYPPSPSNNSPAKSKPRLYGNGLGPAGSPASDLGEDTREMPESIESFPTQNQPVLDTVLKDMLLSLRSTIQTDMATYMHRFNRDIQAVGNRVDHIEEEYAETINDLDDAHDEREGENEWMKAKLADMEDRSRRIKNKGIPETVQQSDLNLYAATLFKNLLPSLTDLDVTINRIHHLPKPTHLSDHIPRDLLL